MIVTREDQERLMQKFVNDHPSATADNLSAFVEGMVLTMNLIDKKMKAEKELEKFYQKPTK